MDHNQMSILKINEDCQLEIIKYIIADCEMRDNSQGNKMKYADLVNFALAHKIFETTLEVYYFDLYESLEFVFVANRRYLEIDFSELETTHTEKGDAFWRLYANAIRQNNIVQTVILKYAPESFQSNFLEHFGIIKRALENKNSIQSVTINLNGYSLEDLNNFGHITELDLDVRMSADALVEVCKANPHLKTLSFRSTEILGRLSDIAPHCKNLRFLCFVPKPDVDGVEYAPLAELPNLEEMNINRASENGSLLNIFEAITKWKRPGIQPLKIYFSEILPRLRKVNIARVNSYLKLNLRHDPRGIHFSASYDFWDISKYNSPLEHSLATIPLIESELSISFKQLTLHECPKRDSDISGFILILKLLNIKSLKFGLYLKDQILIAKLLASIISDESLALKSINTGVREIDQFVISELVKIKSITSLTCRLLDWKPVELLSTLTNLETIYIVIDEEFDFSSKALCSLINCYESGVIECSKWRIEFLKIESIISQSNRNTALTIWDGGEAISHIFKALSYRELITIEALNVSKCVGIKLKELLKMAEVHPIKKLSIRIRPNDTRSDIGHLADLAELELLIIYNSVKGSLIKLFDQMAMKASPSLQSLKINSIYLSSEELLRVSKIRSLKKLDLCDSEPEDCESLMELANSNIEQLFLAKPKFSLQKLFSAFSANSATRLQQLVITEIPNRRLEICELKELSKIKSLKSLQCTCLHNDVPLLRNFEHLVNLGICLVKTNLEELRCLAELEKFESLTFFWHEDSIPQNYEILADIQNLKELYLLADTRVNLTNVYKAFVSKNVKLTHLTTRVGYVEELNAITQIKSLRDIHILIPFQGIRSIDKKLTRLGELSELDCLEITLMDLNLDSTKYIICVLSILKCCRNLDCLIITLRHSLFFYSILRTIYTRIKSIRDPTVQGPLTVILRDYKRLYEKYENPEILVVLFQNVYLKVLTSPEKHYFFY